MNLSRMGSCLLIAVMFGGLAHEVAAAGRWTVSLDVDGKRLEGMPIIWSKQEVRLLARDGQMHQIDPAKAKNTRKVSDGFRGYSQNEMRRRLQREFGRGFQITGTGHFLVVHPVGQAKRWSEQFERLYRTSRVYFSSRGVRLTNPPFTMVAVVFPTENQFRAYAARKGTRIPSNYLGFYDIMSNRILMFDFQRLGSNKANESINNTLIIHEATHQTAFNLGVHSRFAVPSRWICEGIGTLFEAPGIHDAQNYRSLKDRVNDDLIYTFRQKYPQGANQSDITALIADDRMFTRNPESAYALSWALTFMMAEQKPRSLALYLQKTSSRQLYTAYSASERLQDFTAAFGRDLRLVSIRLNRFIDSLP